MYGKQSGDSNNNGDNAMDTMILVVEVGLIILYIGFAVRFIYSRKTIGTSILSSALLAAGGLIAVPVAEAIAAVVCYLFLTVIVLAFIGAMFSG